MSKFVHNRVSYTSFSFLTRHRRSIANGALVSEGIPAASNMREITWDDELADLAEIWASQCYSVIDPKRKALFGNQQVSVSFTNYKTKLLYYLLICV